MNDDPILAPHLERSALITIDAQRDTLDNQPAEIPGTSAALPAMRALAQSFRDAGRPIVHVVRLYQPDGGNVDLCRRSAVLGGARLFLLGSPGAELAPDLAVKDVPLEGERLLAGELQHLSEDEAIIYKSRWGAFYRTSLQTELARRGIDTLVFAGANFPNCPRTSIYEASERDYRIIVARGAVSRLGKADEEQLEAIGVHVWDAAKLSECLAQLSVPQTGEERAAA